MTLTYTLDIVSPTTEEVNSLSSSGFSFDADSLILTASGLFEYKDAGGIGYHGIVEFELCLDSRSSCA